MKKTFSMIYRLLYIILLIWALISAIGKNILSPTDLNVVSEVVFLAVIFLMFIFSLSGEIPSFILAIKRFCTFLSLILILFNLNQYSPVITVKVVIMLVLPLMMFIDFILFDSKKNFNLNEILWWLAVLILLLAALWGLDCLINKRSTDFIQFLNSLFPIKDILPKLAVALALFVLLSTIGTNAKHSADIIMNILRICFLIAEISAFFAISGKSIVSFLSQIKNYELLVNLACFLFVAVALISTFFGRTKKTTLAKLRIYFLYLSLTLFVMNTFIVSLDTYGGYVKTLFLTVCPAYMIMEWLFFSVKKTASVPDIIIMPAIPIIFSFFIYIITSAFPPFAANNGLAAECIKWAAITSLVVYICDRAASNIA